VAVRATHLAHAAALNPATTVWDFLSDLTSRSEPPHGLVERLHAVHLIERAAWEFIATQVAAGFQTHAAGYIDYARVLAIVESSEWSALSTAIRDSPHEYLQPPLAVRVRSYVDAHASERVTLHDIARTLGVSVRRLTDAFRRHFGTGVHRYLARRRLRVAIALLLTTDMKVSAVATTVGYRDQTAMFRQFSRVLGTTPRSVRAQRERAVALMTLLETDAALR
jgi:AraC-like DNA-binding protein